MGSEMCIRDSTSCEWAVKRVPDGRAPDVSDVDARREVHPQGVSPAAKYLPDDPKPLFERIGLEQVLLHSVLDVAARHPRHATPTPARAGPTDIARDPRVIVRPHPPARGGYRARRR